MGEPIAPLLWLPEDLPARLTARIVVCESGCWEWQGAHRRAMRDCRLRRYPDRARPVRPLLRPEPVHPT